MSDTTITSEAAAPRGNLPEFTVSELSSALKRRIEESFSYVRVRGEVSGFKRHSSGHCYLALKDSDAVLDAVCWRGTAMRLTVKPEDGMEVVCTGKLTTFPGRSKYQLVIDTMELAGIGALLKLLEERKQRLAAEGLFDAERKKKLPFLPRVIGVVTSPTGAVLRDIMHRLNDRFPRPVLLWPVAVQGEAAAAQVAAAIAGFNAIAPGGGIPRPDLLIVARGGGSLEDLMAFNEEIVVRAAAASMIPLISAVGHETDTTLIDFASDRRAPTPTAAAEIAVPVRLDLIAETAAKGGRLAAGLARFFAERRMRLEGLGRGLPDPRAVIGTKTQLLDDRAERLRFATVSRLRDCRSRVAALGGRLRDPRHQMEAKSRALGDAAHRLDRAFTHFVALEAGRVAGIAQRLRPDMLDTAIDRARARYDDQAPRLDVCGCRFITRARECLDNFASRLDSLAKSHEQILERGYALVRKAGHHEVIGSAAKIPDGALLTIEFADGEVAATAGTSRRRAAKTAPAPAEQGKLL
jgi:exodeoxyribonuclease VII large subunit